MTVGYQPVTRTAANFADNLCRWNGRNAGHYEAWFLTLNQRATQRGFWFRYTIESPFDQKNKLEPRAALWASVFDRLSPKDNFALMRTYPLDQFAFEGREQFSLRIGDSCFSYSSATGRIEDSNHSLEWDLSFTPNEKTYHHITPALAQLTRPSSLVCSPNLDTRFSGRIIVDGSEIVLEDEPGCQSHLWGRKHVDDWVWVHSNAFVGHAETVFEGLAARQRRAGRMMPPIQSLLLRHRGEEHHFVRLRLAEQWRRNLGIGFWSFSAMNRRIYIEGSAQCRLRDMLQVEYHDPDGEPLYCINSEVANLKIRLFRRIHGMRWRHVETIKAHATAHLEHASRMRDPIVRSAFSSSEGDQA